MEKKYIWRVKWKFPDLKSQNISFLKILFAFSTHSLTKYFTIFFKIISFSLSHTHTHIFEWTRDPKVVYRKGCWGSARVVFSNCRLKINLVCPYEHVIKNRRMRTGMNDLDDQCLLMSFPNLGTVAWWEILEWESVGTYASIFGNDKPTDKELTHWEFRAAVTQSGHSWV